MIQPENTRDAACSVVDCETEEFSRFVIANEHKFTQFETPVEKKNAIFRQKMSTLIKLPNTQLDFSNKIEEPN
jgi:hypothetical protein